MMGICYLHIATLYSADYLSFYAIICAHNEDINARIYRPLMAYIIITARWVGKCRICKGSV